MKQEKDEEEKFLNELFIVMQSRVFPLSMCVMMTYLAISIFHSILNKARTIFFFIHVLTRKCNSCHMRLGQFSIIDWNFQFNLTATYPFCVVHRPFICERTTKRCCASD